MALVDRQRPRPTPPRGVIERRSPDSEKNFGTEDPPAVVATRLAPADAQAPHISAWFLRTDPLPHDPFFQLALLTQVGLDSGTESPR